MLSTPSELLFESVKGGRVRPVKFHYLTHFIGQSIPSCLTSARMLAAFLKILR